MMGAKIPHKTMASVKDVWEIGLNPPTIETRATDTTYLNKQKLKD